MISVDSDLRSWEKQMEVLADLSGLWISFHSENTSCFPLCFLLFFCILTHIPSISPLLLLSQKYLFFKVYLFFHWSLGSYSNSQFQNWQTFKIRRPGFLILDLQNGYRELHKLSDLTLRWICKMGLKFNSFCFPIFFPGFLFDPEPGSKLWRNTYLLN